MKWHNICLTAILLGAVCSVGPFMLFGCGKECNDKTTKFELPKELEGYRIYQLQSSGSGVILYVIVPPDTVDTKPIYMARAPSKNVAPMVMIIDGKRYKLVEEEESEKGK